MFRVLVVDDEDKIRECFAGFLSLKGYEVREACDGVQAVTAAARESFDVILMDIRMPLLDGLSAWRQIRGVSPSAKLILITGLQRPAEDDPPLEKSAAACLHKPVLLHDLEAVVGDVCTRN